MITAPTLYTAQRLVTKGTYSVVPGNNALGLPERNVTLGISRALSSFVDGQQRPIEEQPFDRVFAEIADFAGGDFVFPRSSATNLTFNGPSGFGFEILDESANQISIFNTQRNTIRTILKRERVIDTTQYFSEGIGFIRDNQDFSFVEALRRQNQSDGALLDTGLLVFGNAYQGREEGPRLGYISAFASAHFPGNNQAVTVVGRTTTTFDFGSRDATYSVTGEPVRQVELIWPQFT